MSQAFNRTMYTMGKITQQGVEKANQVAQANEIPRKAQELKDKAIRHYEDQTGRSAELDTKILKYSAIATAGAVSVSTLPAVMVAGAVGTALFAGVKANTTQLMQEYHETTGRDPIKDQQSVIQVAQRAKTTLTQGAQAFQQGYSS